MDERERYDRARRVVEVWARRHGVYRDVEDLVQEGALGFERGWAKTGSIIYSEKAALGAAIDCLRQGDRNFIRARDRDDPEKKRHFQIVGLDEATGVPAHSSPPDSGLVFRELLRGLPARTAAIALLIAAGVNGEEVAKLYGLTGGRVTQILTAAREQLDGTSPALQEGEAGARPRGGGMHDGRLGRGAGTIREHDPHVPEETLAEVGRRFRDARRSSRVSRRYPQRESGVPPLRGPSPDA